MGAEGSGSLVEGLPPARNVGGMGRSHVLSAVGPGSSRPPHRMMMRVSAPHPSRQGGPLVQQLALVREVIARLETKLRDNDPDRVPKEDDQGLRVALQGIGDDRLTRFTMGYAVCVRGLTAPLASGAWKRELAEEVDEAHRRVLARLETLERLALSSAGRLFLRIQAALRRIVLRPRRHQRPISPEENGNLQRPA